MPFFLWHWYKQNCINKTDYYKELALMFLMLWQVPVPPSRWNPSSWCWLKMSLISFSMASKDFTFSKKKRQNSELVEPNVVCRCLWWFKRRCDSQTHAASSSFIPVVAAATIVQNWLCKQDPWGLYGNGRKGKWGEGSNEGRGREGSKMRKSGERGQEEGGDKKKRKGGRMGMIR